MPDVGSDFQFPDDDSLCERCGYPIKGLSFESQCPECGLDVVESSPDKRTGYMQTHWFPLQAFALSALDILIRPSRAFREMSVEGSNGLARVVLFFSAFIAALVWYFTGYQALGMFGWSGVLTFVVVYNAIIALTYIEMLGVTAVCRRRGWRVPFSLAERVCCYAAVGWLPGLLLAGGGGWLLAYFSDGNSVWFDQLLGLVRVRWLFYGVLFVISVLWFETLVWTAIRQVKYANRRSRS